MVVTQHAQWAVMIKHAGMFDNGVDKVPFKSWEQVYVSDNLLGRGKYGAGVRHGRSVI